MLINTEDGNSAEMPKYRCHKEVYALKIMGIDRNPDGSASIIPDDVYAPLHVDAEYMQKHTPEAGGYFVAYEDGYLSYSPAGAFEAGYTRI